MSNYTGRSENNFQKLETKTGSMTRVSSSGALCTPPDQPSSESAAGQVAAHRSAPTFSAL